VTIADGTSGPATESSARTAPFSCFASGQHALPSCIEGIQHAAEEADLEFMQVHADMVDNVLYPETTKVISPETTATQALAEADEDSDNVSGRYYNPQATWEYMLAQRKAGAQGVVDPYSGDEFVDRCKPWRLARWGAPEVSANAAEKRSAISLALSKLKIARWYSRHNTGAAAFKSMEIKGRADLERRLVWGWMAFDTSEEARLKPVRSQTGVEGIVLPYGPPEEGLAYDGSDHTEQPRQCYQYKLRVEWLESKLVEPEQAQDTTYVWSSSVSDPQNAANKLIEADLQSGKRVPQTNRERTLWHKCAPPAPPDPPDLSGGSAAPINPADPPRLPGNFTSSNDVQRRIIYKIPSSIKQRFFKRKGSSAQSSTDAYVGSQGLKYLYPYYEYRDVFKPSGTKAGSRENRRPGQVSIQVVFVDINGHAPLLFENVEGQSNGDKGLRPEFMQPSSHKVQNVILNGGFYSSDEFESSNRERVQPSAEGKELVDLLISTKRSRTADLKATNVFTEAEVTTLPQFEKFLEMKDKELGTAILKYNNLQESSTLATDAFSKRKGTARTQTEKNALFITKALNSNLGKPESLCDVSLIHDDAALNKIEYSTGPSAAASTADYPLEPGSEPTGSQTTASRDDVKVVFFPTLPSVAETADYPASSPLACNLYGYDIDGLNRGVNGDDSRPRIPPVWRFGQFISNASSISTGIVNKMLSDDFLKATKEYKESVSASTEAEAAWVQGQTIYNDAFAIYNEQRRLWDIYTAWYNSLQDAEDQSAVSVSAGFKVKRIKVTYSSDFTIRSLLDQNGNPLKFPVDEAADEATDNSASFTPADYQKAGFVNGVESNAKSWYLQPSKNEAHTRFLQDRGVEDLSMREDWAYYVPSGKVAAQDVTSNWETFRGGVQDFGFVYAWAPPREPEAPVYDAEPPVRIDIPTLDKQMFKTGEKYATKHEYIGINANILDDVTFMHVIKSLTTKNNGKFESIKISKKTGLVSTTTGGEAITGRAYIIPYALYNKDKFETMSAQDQSFIDQESRRAAAAEEREATRLRLKRLADEAAARASKRAGAEQEADLAAKDALKEAQTRMNSLQLISNWRANNMFAVASYFPTIEVTSSTGERKQELACDLSVLEWCDAWRTCRTDVYPYEYRLMTEDRKNFKRKDDKTTVTLQDFGGFNVKEGMRYEDPGDYEARLSRWNDEKTDPSKKLPWKPERHEPSFSLVARKAFMAQDPPVTVTLETIHELVAVGHRGNEGLSGSTNRINEWTRYYDRSFDRISGRAAFELRKSNRFNAEREVEREKNRDAMQQRIDRSKKSKASLSNGGVEEGLDMLRERNAKRRAAASAAANDTDSDDPDADVDNAALFGAEDSDDDAEMDTEDLGGVEAESEENMQNQLFSSGPAGSGNGDNDSDYSDNEEVVDDFDEEMDGVGAHAAQIDRLNRHVVGDIHSCQTTKGTERALKSILAQCSDSTFVSFSTPLNPVDRYALKRLRDAGTEELFGVKNGKTAM